MPVSEVYTERSAAGTSCHFYQDCLPKVRSGVCNHCPKECSPVFAGIGRMFTPGSSKSYNEPTRAAAVFRILPCILYTHQTLFPAATPAAMSPWKIWARKVSVRITGLVPTLRLGQSIGATSSRKLRESPSRKHPE